MIRHRYSGSIVIVTQLGLRTQVFDHSRRRNRRILAWLAHSLLVFLLPFIHPLSLTTPFVTPDLQDPVYLHL